MLKTFFSWLMTLLAPQLAIPARLGAAALAWRPSFSQILAMIFALLFAIMLLRIDGIHIKPQIGPIHFTLIDIEGYKREVVDLKDQIVEMKSKEELSHQAQVIVNSQPNIGSNALVETLNAQSPIVSQKVNEALNAYIADHPVSNCISVRQQGASVLSGDTSVRQPTSASTGSVTNDVAPDMVAIPATDLQHWTDNTKALLLLRAYLQATTVAGWTTPYKAPDNTSSPKTTSTETNP